MKYNIWIEPHMPNEGEKESGFLYIPKSHQHDNRLTHLDKTLYMSLCIKEQIDDNRQFNSIGEIIKDIKTHPDKDEEILKNFFQQTGKDLDTITDAEFDSLPRVPLTYKDVKKSLRKLVKLGYIELIY